MYKDTEQFSTVMLKWIDAKSALYELKDQPAYTTAHVRWEQACLVMDKTKENCAALCQMLDGLTTSMRQCQQPKTVLEGLTTSLRQCQQPEAVAKRQRRRRKSADPAPDDISSFEANSTGLAQARGKKRSTARVDERRSRFLSHLLEAASNGLPLAVRDLYASFRVTISSSVDKTDSHQLRALIKEICNNADGVEYVILKDRTPEVQDIVQQFTPLTTRRNPPPQTLAGKVDLVEDKTLFYYISSVKRKYHRDARPRPTCQDPVCKGEDQSEQANIARELQVSESQNNHSFSVSFGFNSLPGSNENSLDGLGGFGFSPDHWSSLNCFVPAAAGAQSKRMPVSVGNGAGDGGGGDGEDGGGEVVDLAPAAEGAHSEQMPMVSVGDGEGDGGGVDDKDGGGEVAPAAAGAQSVAHANNGVGNGGGDCVFAAASDSSESGLVDLALAAEKAQLRASLEHIAMVSVGKGSGDGGEDGGGEVALAAAAAPGRGRRRGGGAAAASRRLGHDRSQVSVCVLCSDESDIELRYCPNCKAPVCQMCSSISVGLCGAVKPFLQKRPCAAWVELHCLVCQSVEDFDQSLSKCLQDVLTATENSLKSPNIDSSSETLWYYVGLLFAVGGPFSGVVFPDQFRQSVEKMLIHETKPRKGKRPGSILSSISPWEAEMLGLDPGLILTLARNHAGKYKLKPFVARDEPHGRRPLILYVSADIGHHPTAHLMSGELKAMATSKRADVWLLCVAAPDRLAALDISSSPYRTVLKQVYRDRFLELGGLKNNEIAERINQICPHLIYLAGFHQDGDRIAIFEGLTSSPVIVQGVAHASTTGSNAVHRLLCNQHVLPENLQKNFSEKFLYVDAPFLPNSFKEFFSHDVERLTKLRNDVQIRRTERESCGMPHAKVIGSIAKPDRLESQFFDMAIAILRANPDTVLVLVDHGYPAFRQRKEASFKKQGLEGRIVFMPFQDLPNGDLHRFLALIDVCLDTPLYNAHTAGHDALWANGVLITVEGTRLPSRIGADLQRYFGCPENICKDAAEAVARVNGLLQDPLLLSEARAKADRCRASSTMYDNAHRAEIVIEALLRAFEDTVEESVRNQRKRLRVCSASESQQLLKDELPYLSGVMGGLGIELTGESESNGRFLMLWARFRHVSVVVKITHELDAAFRELLARDGKLGEFGLQLYPQLLPFDENLPDSELDVLQMPCNGKNVFAVIEEVQAHHAAAMFDALSQEWRAKPAEGTVIRTSCLILALLKVLNFLHARRKAYGGDPRDCKLSRLEDGYHKRAPAYVEHLGEVYSLLLGGADHLIDLSAPCTFSTQESSNAEQKRRGATQRSSKVWEKSQRASSSAVRTSLRRIGSNASIPARVVRETLIGSGHAAQSDFNIAKAQRDDLRKAAMAVLNAILGRTGQGTVVAGEWRGACDLFRVWLETLSDDEFRNMTGISCRNPVADALCHHSMNTPTQFKALFELLALLLGEAPLDAKGVLDSNPFSGMAVPSNAYPDGLESAPEAVRNDLQACPPLMRRIEERVLHMYVAGRTLEWNKDQKTLIPVWLVYTWEQDQTKLCRSLFTAAEGKLGNLGAIYHSPLVTDDALTIYLSKVHFLQFPGCKTVMDGRPRAFDDTPKAVAAGEVAQYANSSQNETGCHTRMANCTRDWHPEWKSLDTTRSARIKDDAAMGLRLTRNVDKYEELLYPYTWGKYDSDHLRHFTASGKL